MLLVLSNRRFPLDHLHFHGTGYKELTAVLTISRLVIAILLLLSKDGVVLCASVAVALVLILLMVSDSLCRGCNIATAGLVTTSASTGCSNFSRILIVSIQLMDVQRVSTLVHVGVVPLTSLKVAIDLDGLGAVALLGVEFASVNTVTYINRFDEESLLLVDAVIIVASSVLRVSTNSSSLLTHHGLASRVKSKVGLSHQLLIERGVHTILTLEVLLLASAASVSRVLGSSLEKLREDTLLLLVHVLSVITVRVLDTETLSLDGVVELALALGSGIGCAILSIFTVLNMVGVSSTTILTSIVTR